MARTGFGKSATSKVSADSGQIAEMIRKKAYELYEKRGKKCGRSMDDWLEAERIIKQKSL